MSTKPVGLQNLFGPLGKQLPAKGNESTLEGKGSVPSLADTINTETDFSSSGVQQQMEQLLTSGSTITPTKPLPESCFAQNQVPEMLKYHNGYNVFTKNGLLQWQHYVLDQVGGQGAKATKSKGGNAVKLPKSIRAEQRQTETQSEHTLIQVNVSNEPFSYQYEIPSNFAQTA